MREIILRQIKIFTVTIFFLQLLCFCGTKKENFYTPEGMIKLNLSKYGKPFSIFIPDTSALKFNISETVQFIKNLFKRKDDCDCGHKH